MLILIGDLENIIDVSSWAIDKLSDNRHDRFIVRKLLRHMVLKDETGIVLLRQVTPCLPAAFAGMLLAYRYLKIRQGVSVHYGSSLPHSTWIFRRHSPGMPLRFMKEVGGVPTPYIQPLACCYTS